MAQPLQGAEPPMFLQRPSSARSQDIAHILAHTFRELFTRDSVGQDTVQYLNKSRGGDDIYHERYVDSLQKVQEERERRLAEVAMLERHIMQAQARAMSADERALNRVASAHSQFPDLGLPPSRSHFRSCIDTELLRDHNLLTPEDFATEEPPIVPPPQRTPSAAPYLRQTSSLTSRGSVPSIPMYARETVTSQKKRQEDAILGNTPLPLMSRSIHSSLSSDSGDSGFDMPPVAPPAGSRTWEQQVNPEQREGQRIALANLQAKVDYLKNPRHTLPAKTGLLIKSKKKAPKEVGIKPKPNQESVQDNAPVFLPSPPVVRFSDYHVGQVYEITLELKNVTRSMRPVRIVPPRTTFFSVGLGQFPGEQGLVAPGMSCRYTMRFSPDSLSDFDDYVTVQTQGAAPLIVPLQGRRPPPVITLPENISVGQCLVGGCKISRLMIQNDGGPGRFCIMRRDAWPASNFKRTVASSSVHMAPFEVRPAVFEMDRGAKTIVEVLFSPTGMETYHNQLTMVCDNCHVRHFNITGEGQTPGVELMSVEGGMSAAAPGELCDVTAQHLVRFDPLNPYTYYQRAIHVKNLSNVELPFSWVVVKPLLEPPDPERQEGGRGGAQERVQDVDAGFSIEPQNGMLPASGVAEFIVTFAPPKIQQFHSVLHLILRNIPRTKMATIERPASATSDGIAEIMLPQGGTGGPGTHDLTALEVEFKGECQPFSVMLQPYAVYIPGQILVETSVKRQFRMINTSVSSVLFQWDKIHLPEYIMEVEPPIGELGPQEELEFDLTVSGSRPGQIQHTVLCHVQHLDDPLTLHVHADIKGPEVQIENSDVNFGLVRLGDTVDQTVRIQNLCQVSAMWVIRESPEHANPDPEQAQFVFSPPGGELRPLETLDVTVTFVPRHRQSLRTVFEVLVQDGSQSAVMARGEVQSPQACLLTCQVQLDDVYLDVPSLHGVSLLNQTLLPTRFEWGEAEGADAEVCSVSIQPVAASLGPREEVPIAITFTAHRPGPVTDLRVACHVTGMDAPLYLAICGDVLGLRIIYKTSESADNTSGEESVADKDLLLDFGTSVLSETPRRYLHITNNSAISAPYSLLVNNFPTKPPTPPEGRPQSHMPNKSSQRRALIGRVSTLAPYQPKSSTGSRSDPARAMLGAGRGASFLVTPVQGMLQPFSTQTIEVTGFADMWGEYTDTLHCRVENLPVQKLPIKMNVTGCPLQFQMVAVQPAQKPILRFGTHISGVKPVVRQMRINNLSPFDVRLDWQVFNNDASSKQLVDLVTTFGTAFPLKNPDGCEIVPAEELGSEYSSSEDEEEDLTPVRPRLPTDMIANSPSTTPAFSREPTQAQSPYTQDSVFTAETPAPAATPAVPAAPQPKVISLTLREHSGVISNKPYQIQQEQLVIPAKSNSNINVTLTPLSESDTSAGDDCIAYALGYMSLTEEVAEVEGQVIRRQAFDVSPLRLDMTAHVKPALLTIECTEEEGMQYQSAASDLLHPATKSGDGMLKSEHVRLCSTRLSNHTETPLVFQLVTSAPFYLVLVDRQTKQPVAQMLHTDDHTLHPRHNMMVQVGFRLSPDLFDYVEKLMDNMEQDGVELKVHGHERKLHFKQDLVIQFNNNTTQRLPLSASLTIPALLLSVTELDFGTCLVGQRREMQLELSNPTGSASDWTTIIDSKSDTCTKETFELTPDVGTLDAYVTYVSKSKTLLKVFFTAKHTESYDIVYRFQGMLGETPCHLRVRGEGSYDGKHEAVVNV